ncbi:hypothetical protein AYI69_g5674 [Smittium culicis]|uniref:Uncharacterized protein n=1 Tax=Smittium culicis TaxID=133412 RepID=A0A1R1Y4Q8_9FUNG|nr:hypothetical protein AYI69_g5674 [Smittium culicis]
MFKKTLFCISAALANVIVANNATVFEESLVSWETKVNNAQFLDKKHYNVALGQNQVSGAYWSSYAGHSYFWGAVSADNRQLQYSNEIRNKIIICVNSLKTLLSKYAYRMNENHANLVTQVNHVIKEYEYGIDMESYLDFNNFSQNHTFLMVTFMRDY